MAHQISRRFGRIVALDRVSFEAKPGAVLGFLGPNGAGKTTAMRIVTGYLEPTDGRVEVCGLDVSHSSRAARAKLGYLPESVPLYPEMRVEEYLLYRAALKSVAPTTRRARVAEVAEQVGIADERRRIIGQLSKGYRQRVGLADALVAEPEVLILDEPTDGLDPNQRREILHLIAELGRTRTVILSTHILPEVETLCSHVVILDHGRVVAAGRPAELIAGSSATLLVVARAQPSLVAALEALAGVARVTVLSAGEGLLRLRLETTAEVREEVAATVLAHGALRELRPSEGNLETLFARLTASAPSSPSLSEAAT